MARRHRKSRTEGSATSDSNRPVYVGRVTGFTARGLPWLDAEFPSPSSKRSPSSIPVDLPGTLPGELVRYEVLGRGAFRARGRLLEILEPSSTRIEARCPLVGRCGGCDRMHLRLDAQHEFKRERIRDALNAALHETPNPSSPSTKEASPCAEGSSSSSVHPISTVVNPHPVVSSPSTWAYRKRAKFTFFGKQGALRLGAYQADSHWLLELGDCPVTEPRLLEARDRLCVHLSRTPLAPYIESTGRGTLRHVLMQLDPGSGDILATLVVAHPGDTDWPELAQGLLEPELRKRDGPGPLDLESPNQEGQGPLDLESRKGCIKGVTLNVQPHANNVLLGQESRHLAGLEFLRIELGERVLLCPPGVFSQVNLEVAGLIYRQITEWTSDLDEGGALDLYCGIGAIGLNIGRRVPWGIGVESSPSAVRAARASAAEADLNHWQFEEGDVARVLEAGALKLPGPLALVALNPPRRGAGVVLDSILVLGPGRILYLSCNPASLAADLKVLCAGGYRIRDLLPFDMFPHTRHVETLVCLERA